MIGTKKIIRAIRLILALAAGIVVSYLIRIPMSGWVTVTTTVVLFEQSTVGGTISRSSLRFMATFWGAITSLFCILFLHNNWLLTWLVLAISSFFYAYLYMDTKKSYIGVLGIVTSSIILLGNSEPDLYTALYRLVDIVIGISIALISMLVIFPEYAADKSRNLIFTAIQDIYNLIQGIKGQTNGAVIREQILKVENKFVNDIVNFNKTIEEARLEWKAKRNSSCLERYNRCFLQIRRLYRLIIVIFYYEIDNDQLDDPFVNKIFNHILNILSGLNPQVETILFDKEEHQMLGQLISQLKDPSLRKTSANFARELATLNQLLVEEALAPLPKSPFTPFRRKQRT